MTPARSVTGALLLWLVTASAALAASYPDHPIRLVVPGDPGGPTDVLARVVADGLGELLGQKLVIEDKAGAGGVLSGEAVVRAAPDGYTLLYANSSVLAINPALYPTMSYDPATALVPITWVSLAPMMLVVNPKFPARSIAQLVRWGADHPGALSFGSSGIGALPHLTYALFQSATGLDSVHVPYNGGGKSLAAVVAGEVPVTFEVMSIVRPRVASGDLVAIACAGPARAPELPDVPTIAESGWPDVISVSWTGLVAPAGVPPEIVALLGAKTNALLATPAFRARFATLGVQVKGGTQDEFRAWAATERARWTKVVQLSGAKPN
jgi:tripartite-type tricarboxylate transporter receptor subunit TctC